MDLFQVIIIIGIILAVYLLYSIKKHLETITEIVEMSEQQRHDYNLSIDEPDLYEDVLMARESEKLNKKIIK